MFNIHVLNPHYWLYQGLPVTTIIQLGQHVLTLSSLSFRETCSNWKKRVRPCSGFKPHNLAGRVKDNKPDKLAIF